jgi:cell division protein FtsB
MAQRHIGKILLIVVGIVIVFLPPFARYQELSYKSRLLDYKIKSAKAEIERLEDEKRRLETDINYIEKKARDKLGLVRKGEIVIKEVPKKTASK